MRPRRKQKIRWSPELAYVVGLLATDGSLSIDGRHIDFTSKDVQLLKTFKKCLGLKNKIGSKTDGKSNKKYYRIQFGNINFYKWLLKIGLTPHKSKTIGKLKIPNKYFFDFLRGHFDGDGSFYSYWDKRWETSYMFYTYFHSANYSHIKWFRGQLKKFLNIWGSISFENNSVWRLKYAKEESGKILPRMYYSSKAPFLKRKYLKIKRAEVEELEDSLL